MKVNTTLPDNTSPSDVVYMTQVYSGIVQGWSHLPQSIQQTVEWAGMKFIPNTGNLRIEIEVKLSLEFNPSPFGQTFHKPSGMLVIDDTEPGNQDRVALAFRKSVLSLLGDYCARLTGSATSLATLLK